VLELMVVLVVAGFMLALCLPRVGGVLDQLAADAAARDVTTALAAARQSAMGQGRRIRVRFGEDSIRLDTLGVSNWGQYRARAGPASRGVALSATNPVVIFSANGLTWGVSNTSVSLTRGSHVETVVVSRVGRVRRG